MYYWVATLRGKQANGGGVVRDEVTELTNVANDFTLTSIIMPKYYYNSLSYF